MTEKLSLPLKQEYTLHVFKNKLLMRIFETET